MGGPLAKLLLLALVIAAVWYGYRWIARANAARQARDAAPPPATPVEDMRACPSCGTYVAPRGAAACGRAGCPWPEKT